MQAHDHGQTLVSAELTQDVQQFQLIADIQVGSRLIQHQQFRFLRQCPGQQNPLALAVAQCHKVLTGQRLDPGGAERALHCLMIPFGQNPKGPGIRIASGFHHLPGGHPFGPDRIGHHDRDPPRALLPGNSGKRLPVQEDLSGNCRQPPGQGFQNRGFSGAIRPDQCQDLTLRHLQADVAHQRLSVITRVQVAGLKIYPFHPFFSNSIRR